MSDLMAFTEARLSDWEQRVAGESGELRLIGALRQLLDLHGISSEPETWENRKPTGHTAYWCWTCDHDRDYNYIPHREEGCETARILTAIWCAHADYRQEWAPAKMAA